MQYLKFIVLSILLQLVPTRNYAQYENVWAFGSYRGLSGAGIDFNSGSPVPIRTALNTGLVLGGGEANASICDAEGKLLFYTEGDTLWDRYGHIMPNGGGLTGLKPRYGNLSSTTSTCQGALIVPMPENMHQYYVFSLTSERSVMGNNFGRLYYSIVDMRLNDGRGDVISNKKSIYLDSNLNEQMCAVAGDRCNVWVIVVPKAYFNQAGYFKSYEVDQYGVNPIPVRSPGINLSDYLWGKLSPSQDGTKIAVTRLYHSLEVYDFDPATGLLSNLMHLEQSNIPVIGSTYIGICFSPDNSKLYTNSNINSKERGLWQYDLSSNNLATIINSRTFLADDMPAADLKLGPDGKIYGMTGWDSSSLSVIHYPNLPGAACQPEKRALTLLPGTAMWIGLPNNIAVPRSLSNDTTYTTTYISCVFQDNIVLKSNFPSFVNQWDNGLKDEIRAVTEPGVYWVRYHSYCHTGVDTFVIHNFVPAPVITVRFMELSTANYYDAYQWLLNDTIIPGATSPVYQVTQNGAYSVAVRQNDCEDTSDIYVITNAPVNIFAPIEPKINVYPNPARNLIYVDGGRYNSIHISILSLDGRQLKTFEHAGELPIEELKAGMYFLRVIAENGQVMHIQKVLKEE